MSAMSRRWVRAVGLGFGATGIGTAALAAPVEWADMSVGTPASPTATWFEPALWDPIGVPTGTSDVRFGRPIGVDVLTLVKFFGVTPIYGFPNAAAQSLVADSALSPSPELSRLTLDMGDTVLPFAGTLTVGQGVFDVGTRGGSNVVVAGNRWGVAHQSTTEPLRVARNGASASIDLVNAPLSVAFRLEVGRGFDAVRDVVSVGSVSVIGAPGLPSGIGVEGGTIVGVDGGSGTVIVGDFANSTFNGPVFVGVGTGALAVGTTRSSGTLSIDETFIDQPDVAFNAGVQVGVNAGQGLATLLSDIVVQPDATNLAFMVGRGAIDDASLGVVRADGGMVVGGRNLGVTATGNAFVGIDGAVGSLSNGFGDFTLNGDLVVGDLGHTGPTEYTPSNGYFSVGLNSTTIINGNVFVGTNDGIGEATLDPSGDGGAQITARYVGIGNTGTGFMIIANMINATFDELEMFEATGIQAQELGGRVQLGVDSDSPLLSLERLRARNEGARFDWRAGTLELRAGRVFDWGDAALVVPAPGVLRGSGRIEADLTNNGIVAVEPNGSPALFNQTIEIVPNGPRPGRYTQDVNAGLQMIMSVPTRLNVNGEQTLIIASDASLDGALTANADTFTAAGSSYWLNDVRPGDTFNLFDFGGPVAGQFANIPIDAAHLPVGLPDLPIYNTGYANLTWDTTRLYTDGVIVVSGTLIGAGGACCRGSTCTLSAADQCVGPNTSFAGAGSACNVLPAATTPCCFADFNQSGTLTVQDLFDFLGAYFAASPTADFNGGGLSVQDLFDFLAGYFAGCG